MPLKVDMRMRDGRNTMKNQAEFRLYNKFGADTSIIFERCAGGFAGREGRGAGEIRLFDLEVERGPEVRHINRFTVCGRK